MTAHMLSSSSVRRLGKRMIPSLLQARIRKQYQGYVFRRSLAKLRALPEGVQPTEEDLELLNYGWGNTSFSASPEYMATCIQLAREAGGPILECGSGLTTVLLGLEAARHGNVVHTLEHIPFWAARVQTSLDRQGISAVRLHQATLKDYGEYHWYDPPMGQMPSEFSLVVCDGPPGRTPGGRYGLLPQMYSRMAANCIVLLDDAHRDRELSIVSRWAEECSLNFEIQGTKRKFALVTRSDAPAKVLDSQP